MIKPRIQLASQVCSLGIFYQNHKYVCHDNFQIICGGNSIDEAYNRWKSKESKRTRVSRNGYLNKQYCINWYKRNCPMIRSYVGSKQIIGYDIITDELILRG